ncbi:MAG: type II toxin-antitoxin system VapC family toxin [Terriglobales bacterium]
MIVDTSVLVAIVLDEAEAERFMAAIIAAGVCRISAVNWLETQLVLESRTGKLGALKAQALLAEFAMERLNLDEAQVAAAYLAWQRFGKGRHPAQLNLADCCAYAASVTSGEPLLFKGNDFALTDVEAAAW